MTPTIFEHLSQLSDPTRVRLLRLLSEEELGVGELASVVQLPQSTVSRHLKRLLDGGWIARRVEGPAALVRMDAAALPEEARRLWEVVAGAPGCDAELTADLERMARVLAQRSIDSRAFFGRVASQWSQVRKELFGLGYATPALLALLPREWVVADLGCGLGEMAELLAGAVARVIAVDQEEAMLDAARARLAGVRNVELRLGELTALPMAAAEVDAAVCALVLHHVEAPTAALAEAARVLRPGGTLVLLDMVEHEREAYRFKMGHRHLGFSRQAVEGHASRAGLVLAAYRRVPQDPEAQGPGLFLATLRVPARAPASKGLRIPRGL